MKPLSVIVADDVLEIQRLIAHVVTAMGHDVVCASSGAEALKLFRARRCDLLIADVLMPDGDGLELISELKRMAGTVRILAISGGGRILDPMYCLGMAKAMGAHASLSKPFDAVQLRAGIAAALGFGPATPASPLPC